MAPGIAAGVRGRDRSWTRTAVGAIGVAVAYYFGSRLGFVLRFPPALTSILWPPNAILTSALLLSAPNRWWVLLLAALPAHLAVQAGVAAFPLPLILALYATNCLEALIAASLVHRFGDAPDRFDTLRRAALFIVAVVLVAPVLSGFVDSAVVAALRHESYWRVWETRLFSNTLTALALVPVLTSLVRARRRLRAVSLGRAAEVAALIALVVVLGGVVFAHAPITGESVHWWEQTEFMLLLPLLLWAAARFGAAGSSCALLTTSVIAFLAATTREDPATPAQAALAVRGLQSFLLLAGIPLFGLGALIEERESIEDALQERLRFEGLLSRISAAFVRLPSTAATGFQEPLRQVVEHSGLSCLMLFRTSEDGRHFVFTSSWSTPGDARACGEIVWSPSELYEHALRNEDLRIEEPDGGWTIGIPLRAGDGLLGALVFRGPAADGHSHGDPRPWLHLVAEVFASALARKESEDALRAGEEMNAAILASLSGHVAVLDRDGWIIAANQNSPVGARPAEGAGGHAPPRVSYAQACQEASSGLPDYDDVAAGLKAVLDGRERSFTLEYSCRTEAGERWFLLSVAPLRRPEGGAVASHVDVTERHRAEDEARRSREELAHFLRVSTVGELTTSIAHELNQPLTAILANAQAAGLLLKEGTDLREVREILGDIIEEDKRAGEVIRRLREMLRKRQPEHAPLDLNALASEVVRLLSSDAALRNVSLRLDLAPPPVVVSGDRIQIQQVVLNLLLNAMDAMADCPEDRRQAVVATAVRDGAVHLTVSDTGIGLREGSQARIFEPFYTTKASGMGMGLSIARSIVDAHGGRIWARDNPGPGATVTFSLPLAVRGAA